MYVIGLTGPIAGGKSTVAALLAERGAEVIDCDRLARDAVAPGQPALDAILRRFGDALRLPDGNLDRAALGRLVFADPAALAALEAIVHPRVGELRDARLRASRAKVAVVEAIKLFEAGFAAECDTVWIVTAPTAVRLRRLVEQRSFDIVSAQQRMAAQGDFSRWLAQADEVLVNDGDPAHLSEVVAAAWSRWVPAALR